MEKMTNCPNCNKPILNEGQFTSFAQFNLKCPWCQTLLQVKIQAKISAQALRIEPVVAEDSKILARLPYRD